MIAYKFDVGFKIHLAEMGIFNFPFIWHFNTYIAAILKLFFSHCNRFHDGK
jgi:hypothetical protein